MIKAKQGKLCNPEKRWEINSSEEERAPRLPSEAFISPSNTWAEAISETDAREGEQNQRVTEEQLPTFQRRYILC